MLCYFTLNYVALDHEPRSGGGEKGEVGAGEESECVT